MEPTTIPVTYRATWDDDYGVRGWKLDSVIGERGIIAATPHPGDRIPTSVFVHDLVDHHIPGFALSSYRDEAKALAQLATRTGSDPVPDYQQMIDEELLAGRTGSESLAAFLPPELAERLPRHGNNHERMAAVRAELGDGWVRATLTARFIQLGWEGMAEARDAWHQAGLDPERRQQTALALQALFEELDQYVQREAFEEVHGAFRIAPDEIAFEAAEGYGLVRRTHAVL